MSNKQWHEGNERLYTLMVLARRKAQEEAGSGTNTYNPETFGRMSGGKLVPTDLLGLYADSGLHKAWQLNSGLGEVRVIDVDSYNRAIGIDSDEVLQHFDITESEAEALFDADGCDNTKTWLDASLFVRGFLKERIAEKLETPMEWLEALLRAAGEQMLSHKARASVIGGTIEPADVLGLYTHFGFNPCWQLLRTYAHIYDVVDRYNGCLLLPQSTAIAKHFGISAEDQEKIFGTWGRAVAAATIADTVQSFCEERNVFGDLIQQVRAHGKDKAARKAVLQERAVSVLRQMATLLRAQAVAEISVPKPWIADSSRKADDLDALANEGPFSNVVLEQIAGVARTRAQSVNDSIAASEAWLTQLEKVLGK